MNYYIVGFLCILIVFAVWVLYKDNTKNKDRKTPWVKLTITPNLGPMATLMWGGEEDNPKSKPLSTLMDTGSIYLMVSQVDGSEEPFADNPKLQEYHYAGPSANFKFVRANPVLAPDISMGSTVVGKVMPDSIKALGVPAVCGLAPLPTWASQRFQTESLVLAMGIEEFWFALAIPQDPRFLFGPPLSRRDKARLGELKVSVPIEPQIALPTPGLGFATTAVTSLTVRFHDSKTGYRISRKSASTESATTYQFTYDIINGRSGTLQATEWYVLFDTGTNPAVFYADATANLLGTKVTQSMVKGQTESSDFTQADVSYAFGKYGTVTANNVQVPTMYPTSFSALPELMTVCGFGFQDGNNMRYVIDKSNGLPSRVEFYA